MTQNSDTITFYITDEGTSDAEVIPHVFHISGLRKIDHPDSFLKLVKNNKEIHFGNSVIY